jgi:ATP-dependent RNA helicase RhlE
MSNFEQFSLKKPLFNAIKDLGFTAPTPIQEEAFSVILSGKDVVGIAQTGTGKTLAYLMPMLDELKYSDQINPRILILVPTRELVVQVCDAVNSLTEYMSVRVKGVYGGTNINTQRISVAEGADIIVATPGRLYDLLMSKSLNVKNIKKLVIDEVDVMLDLGFRTQLTNLFELIPEKRQNIMFSATMTEDVASIIQDFFIKPITIEIAISGTPLENINQTAYKVRNFYTKVNLLIKILEDKELFNKVLVFSPSKRYADKIHELIDPFYGSETCVIHSNKAQNYRLRSIEQFERGENRILIATDVIARGLDLTGISHVINIDVPIFPENYMHRIGRTGRAKVQGEAILFYTKDEIEAKSRIEELMKYKIPEMEFPKDVELSKELMYEEMPKDDLGQTQNRNSKHEPLPPGFHEKKEKNKKVNLGGSYKRTIAKKYSKPKSRGDKNFGKRKGMK